MYANVNYVQSIPYSFTIIIFILKSLGSNPEGNMPACFQGLSLCFLGRAQ